MEAEKPPSERTLELKCQHLEMALKEKDDYIKASQEKFNKILGAMSLVYAGESFSEGHLARDLKYKVCFSRPIKAKEIDVLIEKLQFDKKILQGLSGKELENG